MHLPDAVIRGREIAWVSDDRAADPKLDTVTDAGVGSPIRQSLAETLHRFDTPNRASERDYWLAMADAALAALHEHLSDARTWSGTNTGPWGTGRRRIGGSERERGNPYRIGGGGGAPARRFSTGELALGPVYGF